MKHINQRRQMLCGGVEQKNHAKYMWVGNWNCIFLKYQLFQSHLFIFFPLFIVIPFFLGFVIHLIYFVMNLFCSSSHCFQFFTLQNQKIVVAEYSLTARISSLTVCDYLQVLSNAKWKHCGVIARQVFQNFGSSQLKQICSLNFLKLWQNVLLHD